MKAHEVFKLAEMLAAFQTKKEDKPMRNRRGPPKFSPRMRDDDVVALLHKKLEEADTLKKMLDDREKANKKDDKKKDGMSTEQIAIFLMMTYPIIGLGIYFLLGHK